MLPDGLTIEPFDEAGVREFHHALDESFRDHWEHHSAPFEEWWEQKQNAPDFDPTLWFLIREGTEIAAVARNDPNRIAIEDVFKFLNKTSADVKRRAG